MVVKGGRVVGLGHVTQMALSISYFFPSDYRKIKSVLCNFININNIRILSVSLSIFKCE
jgi:hypothetical protein